MSEPEQPSHSGGQPEPQASEELFQIIDETGEGFGFEITPEVLAKPLVIGSSTLFGVGMLAGVPLGLALGRTQEQKGAKIRPSFEGLRFAATTFGLGSLLCGVFGVAGFYGIKSYYKVDSFEEFGRAMRNAVPERRRQMESGLRPMLDVVRKNAGDNLPEPAQRLRKRFGETRIGKWIKEQVEISATIPEVSDEKPSDSSTPGDSPAATYQ